MIDTIKKTLSDLEGGRNAIQQELAALRARVLQRERDEIATTGGIALCQRLIQDAENKAKELALEAEKAAKSAEIAVVGAVEKVAEGVAKVEDRVEAAAAKVVDKVKSLV